MYTHAGLRRMQPAEVAHTHLVLELRPQRGRGGRVLHDLEAQLGRQQPHGRALAAPCRPCVHTQPRAYARKGRREAQLAPQQNSTGASMLRRKAQLRKEAALVSGTAPTTRSRGCVAGPQHPLPTASAAHSICWPTASAAHCLPPGHQSSRSRRLLPSNSNRLKRFLPRDGTASTQSQASAHNTPVHAHPTHLLLTAHSHLTRPLLTDHTHLTLSACDSPKGRALPAAAAGSHAPPPPGQRTACQSCVDGCVGTLWTEVPVMC